MSDKKFLWVEEYSPKNVEHCILPTSVKDSFLGYVKEKQFPNLILAGPAGVGKTSVARALCNEIDADLLFVNASLDRGIGDIRNTVAQFASCSSMFGGVKVVLLDEADNLTQDSQKALRALIEDFQNHCRFILTCNYPHNIIDAIHSRCLVFDFALTETTTREKLSVQFFQRIIGILRTNNVTFDDKVLVKFITSKAPDWRGILNNVQGNIADGELSNDIMGVSADTVVGYMKNKDWTKVTNWMFENASLHPRAVERELYNSLEPQLTGKGIVSATLAFGEYSYRIGLGADPVVTLLALSATLMMEAEWK